MKSKNIIRKVSYFRPITKDILKNFFYIAKYFVQLFYSPHHYLIEICNNYSGLKLKVL